MQAIARRGSTCTAIACPGSHVQPVRRPQLGPTLGVPLLFSRAFVHKRCHERIEYLTRTNVVLHASSNANHKKRGPVSSRLLGMSRVCGKNVGRLLSTIRDVAIVNCDDRSARFAHYRVNTVKDGKILVFGTGNVIRAGGCTHADSVLSVIKFATWIQMRTAEKVIFHYSRIHTPNMVLTGKYTNGRTPDHMVNGWRCTKTSKFPGIAIITPYNSTPEVYTGSGKFIIPGVVSVMQLNNVLDIMCSPDAANSNEAYKLALTRTKTLVCGTNLPSDGHGAPAASGCV